MLTPAQIQSLTDRFPSDQIIFDRSRLIVYEQDAGMIKGTPEAVILPASASDVQDFMSWSKKPAIPIIGRGAGTGYTGGAVAPRGGVMVAFSRMNKILEVDDVGMHARVQPGVVNLELQRHIAPLGLSYPPDPASYTVCTIGGNIAENAGGPHCLKYGVTRNYILGIEAVLADGSRIMFGGKSLDQPEYDFISLITGSEGTLTLITEAIVQLCRLPQHVKALTASFESVEQAAIAVSAMIASGYLPSTIEFMDNSMILLVESMLQAGLPTQAGAMLIMDVEGYQESLDLQLDEIAAILQQLGASDVKVARSDSEREKLWSGRRNIGGAIARISPNEYLLDVCVPRSRLAEALTAITQISEKNGFQVTFLAHIGDGNLHPTLLCDFSIPGQAERAQQVGGEILRLCAQMGGSIGGEHGIGIEKREYLTSMYSHEEIEAMLEIKEIFDPDRRLNPGKIFPEDSQSEVFSERVVKSVPPSPWKPVTAVEAADILHDNQSEGKQTYIRGGGSQWRGDASQKDYLLTTGLKGIVKIAPDDLNVVVLAGTSLCDLQSALAEKGFWLPVANPWRGSTIGGLIATNLNGPQRRYYGCIRELVLAVQVVFPDGRLLRFGRPLVKDIAGYNMAKLFVGSFGTLGLLTEVTLKIYPLPRSRRSLVVSLQDLQKGLQLAFLGMRSSLISSGLVLVRRLKMDKPESEYSLIFTTEGYPMDVDTELGLVHRLWADQGGCQPEETDQITATSAWEESLSRGEWIARIGVPSGCLPKFLDRTEKTSLCLPSLIDIPDGFVYSVSADRDAGQASQALGQWRKETRDEKGYAIMMAGPRGWLTLIDAWEGPQDSQALMRGLKHRWDPARILNHGEFNGL